MGSPGDLERPWVRLPLMRALAGAEKNQVQLGVEYGVTQSAISHFASKHRPEIDALKDKLDDEWAGLWVARKAARLAVYQDSLERISAALEQLQMDEDGKLTVVQAKLLRQVAEEVGDLKQDVNITGKVLHHVIEGVDLDDLG